MAEDDDEARLAFINRLRSLYCIDGWLLPELTLEQQNEFLRDPSGYLRNRADKTQSIAIWREIEKRQGDGNAA